MDLSRYKRIFKTITRLPGWMVVIFVLISAVGLCYVFSQGLSESALAYALYPLSAYTLLLVCLRAAPIFHAFQSALHSNTFMHRYLTDARYKLHVSLHLSLAINLAYCALKGTLAILSRSTWLGALAFYYLVLSLLRLLLSRSVRSSAAAVEGYRKFRACGFILLPLTLAVAVISFHTLLQGRTISYPGWTIYAAAAYTFYALISTIVSINRYRKLHNPIYNATKLIALSASLVSLFFLQVALISTFGDGSPALQLLNTITAAVIFTLVGGMAIYMISLGNRRMNQARSFNDK